MCGDPEQGAERFNGPVRAGETKVGAWGLPRVNALHPELRLTDTGNKSELEVNQPCMDCSLSSSHLGGLENLKPEMRLG